MISLVKLVEEANTSEGEEQAMLFKVELDKDGKTSDADEQTKLLNPPRVLYTGLLSLFLCPESADLTLCKFMVTFFLPL
jgi:hypothetical protein